MKKIVRILLDEGTDVSIPQETFEFDTALQAAAYSGFENIVQLVLQNGADVNREGGKYGTAIQAVAIYGHVEIVRLPIQYGANLKVQGGELGKLDALSGMCMIERVSSTTTKPYLGPRRQNGNYETALQAACVTGNFEIVRLLLANGADPSDKDEYRRTPLHRASYEEVVDLLLEQGTNINLKDRLGGTALCWAASYGYRGLLGLLTQMAPELTRKTPRDRLLFIELLSMGKFQPWNFCWLVVPTWKVPIAMGKTIILSS